MRDNSAIARKPHNATATPIARFIHIFRIASTPYAPRINSQFFPPRNDPAPRTRPRNV
jgi:hypothetical protein